MGKFCVHTNGRSFCNLQKYDVLIAHMSSSARSLKLNCQLKISLNIFTCIIWFKVFKNGPSKICGRQPLKKNSSNMFCLYNFKLFKECLPQIFFGPFLNTFTHMSIVVIAQLIYSSECSELTAVLYRCHILMYLCCCNNKTKNA